MKPSDIGAQEKKLNVRIRTLPLQCFLCDIAKVHFQKFFDIARKSRAYHDLSATDWPLATGD